MGGFLVDKLVGGGGRRTQLFWRREQLMRQPAEYCTT